MASKGYFKENNSKTTLILESLDNANKDVNSYVSKIDNENKKIESKVQDFNNTIKTLDPEKDAQLIASIQKKVISLNKLIIENETRINNFNGLNDSERLEFFSNILFPRRLPQHAKEVAEQVKEVPSRGPVSPIQKNKQGIPSPKNALQTQELKDVISKFDNRFQSQRDLITDYLASKGIITT